jgi:RNA polymerase sigma factor (sigma-70 family)
MHPNPWPLLRRLARRPPGEADPVSDAELLARFARDRDQAAFELLVWRHGPMVFGACRRILRDSHLAEDAFQAAFLILARKAGSVRAGGSVAGWLHRVARRVAVRAAKQRRRIEPLAADPPGRPTYTPNTELRAILDAEIDRLPDRFRLPVVLCHLDGRTTEDAARLLGVPRGTILSRLATARQRLAARLTRRGITVPAALAAVAGSGTEVISTEAVAVCVSIAVRFASGVAVPGGSVQLAEGVLHMGTRKIVTTWAIVLIATAGVGTGIAVVADDPKPKAGDALVAAVPTQPDKPPPAPKTVEKDRAEQERRRELAGTIDQLSMEREKLNHKADELQHLIARKQREGLNPQLIRAMEAVLTELELTLFRTEMEMLTEKNQRITRAQREFDDARGKKVDQWEVNAAADRDPAVVKLRESLQQAESQLREVSSAVVGDNPVVKEHKQRVADLTDKLAKARLDARAKAAEEQIEAATRAAKAKLDDAKQSVGGMENVLAAAHNKRAEILEALDKANDRKQVAEIQRLEAELQTNREMARRLSLLAMELDLKLKGLPVPDAPRPAAADDKLDRVLRELAELRMEVRRLGERK